MWLAWLALTLVGAAIFGGILGGGIFIIVLLPLAGIALGTLFVGYLFTRSAGSAGGQPAAPAAPHAASGGRELTSPEGLVDARRQQQ